MKYLVLCLVLVTLSLPPPAVAQTVWLDELDLSMMECGWGTPEAKKSVEGNPLRVGGHQFERGVGTHAVSTMLINLGAAGRRFTASVGVDDEASNPKSSVEFYILGDRKVL